MTGQGGLVIVEHTVSAKGAVRHARAVNRAPDLDEVAVKAVRKWKYQPTVVNGRAVEVVTFALLRFGAPAEPTTADWLDVVRWHLEHGRRTFARETLLVAQTRAQRDRERFEGLFDERLGQLATGEEPPQIVKRVTPAYPFASRMDGSAALVKLEVLIDPAGVVGRTRLVSPSTEMDAPIAQAVGQWTFSPATRHGKPVAALVTVAVAFRRGH